MATAPQPPRASVPSPPPQAGSHIIAIVLLILALIILVSTLTVWTGLRFLSRNVRVAVGEGAGGKKEVSIKTPVGSLEVNQNVKEARLGLPIYPGAKRLKDEASATVNLDLPGEQNVGVVVAKYESPDPFAQVRDFYKDRLGSTVTEFTEKNEAGKSVLKIKRRGEEKIVALESRDRGTSIVLVHITHGPDTTN